MLKNFLLILTALIFSAMSPNSASAMRTKIIFIPHDDRPVSCQQTAEIVKETGANIVMPPIELLGLEGSNEHPVQLWQWFEENAPTARAAVIASDSLLYGGLIPSRKHEFSQEQLSAWVENFKNIREKNPEMKLYVFASLMRTPMQGTKGDIEEPEYYAEYGANIHQCTALSDKQEISKLTNDEKNYMNYLKNSTPQEYFEDWMNRRAKNFSATKKLIDFTSAGIIDYLIVGRDDNAPLCQTHKENRELLNYAAKNNLPKEKFQSLAGIDEFYAAKFRLSTCNSIKARAVKPFRCFRMNPLKILLRKKLLLRVEKKFAIPKTRILFCLSIPILTVKLLEGTICRRAINLLSRI